MTPRLDTPGVSPREAAALRADERALRALAAVAPGAGNARLVFRDDNGPKGGPAIRCTVTVTLPRRGQLHVAATGVSARLALDRALARLRRRLGRTAAAARDARRRPKKYYAARAVGG
jgi:hypothetical protein